MKQKYSRLLIVALLALLLPATHVAAEEAGELSSSVEVGAAGMAVDNEVNKVNEYSTIRDSEGVNPYLRAHLEGSGNDIHIDLDAEAMSNRDQTYDLELDFSRAFRFDASYDTFKHSLSHDQLDYMRATMKNEAQTKPGSANPAVYSEDLTPGKDFFIIHRELEAAGEVVIPEIPNVTLNAGFRKQEREGTEQAFAISHCSACHVTGDAKDVDETTTDITMGASGKFGLVTVDYEYLTRDFEDRSQGMSQEYLLAAKPVDGLPTADFDSARMLYEQQNGDLGYGETPESEKDTHTLKARVDLSNSTVVSGTYINADIESDKQDDVGRTLSKNELSTDYDSYSMRASTRLGDWRITGYGRSEEIESSSNTVSFTTATGNDVSTTDSKSSYESEEARDITTLGTNAVYRITSGTSVRLGYEYEEIDRQIDEAMDTETHTLKASARFRPAKGLNGRVSYSYKDIDDQFTNPHGNMGPTDEDFRYAIDPKVWYGTGYYTQRQAEATTLPEEVHEIKGSLTWAPSPSYAVTVYTRYRTEENDLNFSTYEKDVFSPGVSAWWAPINELNLTMAYNFDKQETENQMCVGWYHG